MSIRERNRKCWVRHYLKMYALWMQGESQLRWYPGNWSNIIDS